MKIIGKYELEKARQEWMQYRSMIHNKKAHNYIDGIVTILDKIYNGDNFHPNDEHLMDLQSVVGSLEMHS